MVGESGSGKTTLALVLMRLAAGEMHGEVSVAGTRIDALPERTLRPLRAGFQMVFQDPFNALSPRMSIAEIVGGGLWLHRPDLTDDAHRTAVIDALQEVGLDPAWCCTAIRMNSRADSASGCHCAGAGAQAPPAGAG